MLQIKNTLGGGKPEGLYAWKKNEISSELKEFNKSVSKLPYNFYCGSAVILNNEIHILGGSDNTTKHYKWDGNLWTSVSTLPYNFVNGSAVVLNGEIHILGGNGNNTLHYKWDGSSWTSVSTLPYNFYQGSTVVLDNEIYILGGRDNTTKHYKWDGNSWTSVSILPYNFVYGSAVVYNNAIHILGSENSSYYTAHYLIIGYVPVYIFLDYIVSDKENAYPDGGVHTDGYYYERAEVGAKVAYGTVTAASATSLTITHGLGVKPDKVIIYPSSRANLGMGLRIADESNIWGSVANDYTNNYNNHIQHTSKFYGDILTDDGPSDIWKTPEITEETINISGNFYIGNQSAKLTSGVTYTWLAIKE